MNKQSIREIFDNISLSVISYLENHTGVSDVEFNSERQGVAEVTLSKWEEDNVSAFVHSMSEFHLSLISLLGDPSIHKFLCKTMMNI